MIVLKKKLEIRLLLFRVKIKNYRKNLPFGNTSIDKKYPVFLEQNVFELENLKRLG